MEHSTLKCWQQPAPSYASPMRCVTETSEPTETAASGKPCVPSATATDYADPREPIVWVAIGEVLVAWRVMMPEP